MVIAMAVQLPKTVQFSGTKVYVKQVGNALMLLPMDQPWESLLASLRHFSDDFLAERDPLPVQSQDDVCTP
jgi:antitoxin VapB